MMSGSSLPYAWRRPWLEPALGTPMTEAVVVGYADLDSFGPHALEALGCIAERREGGESGVRCVQCVTGDRVWEDPTVWWRPLAEEAVARVGGGGAVGGGGYGSEDVPEGSLWETPHCVDPILLTMEYVDGMRGAMLLLQGYLLRPIYMECYFMCRICM